MKRIILTVGAALLVAVPAATGLIGNTSFAKSVPVRVPSHAIIVQYHGGQPTSTPKTRDDHGGQRATSTTEPGDDHGGQGATSTQGPADDHRVTSTISSGNVKVSGGGLTKATVSGGGLKKATVNGSGSGTDDNGVHGQNGSGTGAGTGGSGHK